MQLADDVNVDRQFGLTGPSVLVRFELSPRHGTTDEGEYTHLVNST